MTVDEIYFALCKLTDEERLEIFNRFCIYCGSKEKVCYCARIWDE